MSLATVVIRRIDTIEPFRVYNNDKWIRKTDSNDNDKAKAISHIDLYEHLMGTFS